MSTSMQKTIVITTVPRRTENLNSGKISLLEKMETDSGLPRKRKRLTHLTPEERMLRRKLKNRVAAQTARDRKKAKMSEFEEMIQLLEEQNAELRKDNEELIRRTDNLADENLQLRERLGEVSTIKEEPMSCESAVPHVSLPQGQALVLSLLMGQVMTVLSMMSLTCSLVYSTNSMRVLTPPISKPHSKISVSYQHNHKWWGSHQRNWNPSMN